MQHIALEGRCFVLSCNQFARRSDYPVDYITPFGDDPETVLSRGGSCIVNPLGQLLAGPNFTEECILTAELDLADIARGKYDFDVVGHYARPDVFRLYVNEAPQPAVVWRGDGNSMAMNAMENTIQGARNMPTIAPESNEGVTS
jgi:nitrilase